MAAATFPFSLLGRSAESISLLDHIAGSEATKLISQLSQVNETELTQRVLQAKQIPHDGLSLPNARKPNEQVKLSARDVAAVMIVGIADEFAQSFSVNSWR